MIPLRDANPTRRLPIVTIALIAACFAVWAYEVGLLATGADALDAFVTKWGVVPSEVSAALDHGDFASTPIATLFTSQFLHGGWLHILGNMLYLWIFGNNVEDEFGRLRFLAFYLAGGARRSAHPGRSPRSSAPTSSCTRGRGSPRSSSWASSTS